MSRRKETVDIVEDLVNAIDLTITIDTITDNLDGTYTLTTCETLHLQPGCDIAIDAVDYKIISVANNESITIKGDVIPTATSFTANPIYYFHGTVIQTKIELTEQTDVSLKTPMVYLLEIIQDEYGNRDQVIERTSDLRLFFLANANFKGWYTDDHYKDAILPMRNIVYKWIDILNTHKDIGNIDNYTVINHVNFGVYATDKGHTKQIFNEETSGCEVRITLPIYRSFVCDNKC